MYKASILYLSLSLIIINNTVIKIICVITFSGLIVLTAVLELSPRIFSRNLLINFNFFWPGIAFIFLTF